MERRKTKNKAIYCIFFFPFNFFSFLVVANSVSLSFTQALFSSQNFLFLDTVAAVYVVYKYI